MVSMEKVKELTWRSWYCLIPTDSTVSKDYNLAILSHLHEVVRQKRPYLLKVYGNYIPIMQTHRSLIKNFTSKKPSNETNDRRIRQICPRAIFLSSKKLKQHKGVMFHDCWRHKTKSLSELKTIPQSVFQ